MGLSRHVSTLIAAAAIHAAAYGCGPRHEVGWRLTPPDTGSPSVAFHAARDRALGHWESRDEPAELRAAIDWLEEALRLDPSDAATAALLSRGYYMLAEGTEDAGEATALYERGLRCGEQALAGDPRFRELMRRNRTTQALRALGPEQVPALFWAAANLGRWSEKRGFTTLMANRRRIQQSLQRVSELDANYLHGAPDRFWGAYFVIAPEFAGGDQRRSLHHFERALRIAPEYIGNRVALAEIYAVSVKDRARFEAELRRALATPVDALPDVVPEQRLAQARARRLLERADELFPR